MQSGPYIFTVREVTRYIKTTLERERALQGVLVRGEISNCKYHSSGHLYFTLKDEASQLPCVMWADRVRALGFRCENGMRVTAEGSITVYERGGNYQLSVFAVQADGVGNLYLAFERLKRALEAEGLFARERKRALPGIPRRIALITSPTGAVVHDFVTVSTRRWAGRRILLVPAAVQGAAAAGSLVRALGQAARVPEVDVIVVARGGGSLEELAAFNDEAVVRAIAGSPIPVVSAVGHETDFTLADFAADLRAPTPSAAAELVVPDLQGIDAYLAQQQERITRQLRRRVSWAEREFSHLQALPALRRPQRLVEERRQYLEDLFAQVEDALRLRVQAGTARLAAVEGRLAALDPRGVLLRGYALVTRPADGALLPSAADAAREPHLAIRFADGVVHATTET